MQGYVYSAALSLKLIQSKTLPILATMVTIGTLITSFDAIIVEMKLIAK